MKETIQDMYFNTQKERLEKLQSQIDQSNDPQARQKMHEIQNQQRIPELERLISASRGEADSANEAQRRLIELKVLLDQVETIIEWPALVLEAKEEIERTENVVSKWGNDAAKVKKAELEAEINEAMKSKDNDFLRKRIGDMAEFRYSILWTRPEFHIFIFQSFEEEVELMRDKDRAFSLLTEGKRAIQEEDFNRLIRVNRQLFGLLPDNEARKITQGFGSTVIR